MEEWRHNVSVEHETIRAVINAYAQGDIDIVTKETRRKRFNANGEGFSQSANPARLRRAPSFIKGKNVVFGGAAQLYTVADVATFLGWMAPRSRGVDPAADRERVYTVVDIARFLGWMTPRSRSTADSGRRVAIKKTYQCDRRVSRRWSFVPGYLQ